MKKIIKDRPTSSLENEFMLVQMDRYMDNFDRAMKKSLKGSFIRTIIGCTPAVLGAIGFIITGNVSIAAIGTAITGAGGIAVIIIDDIKETRKMLPKKKSGKIVPINEEKDVDQIVEEGIIKKREDEFYTEEFKQYIERSSKKESIKPEVPKLKVVTNNDDVLSKEDTMIQIVKDIDVYRKVYNLPLIEISDAEWDLLFDSIYQLFERKGITKEFYTSMSRLERNTIVKSLLDKRSKITIYSFIDCLRRLECDKINDGDIALLQQEIISSIPSKNIIDISSYMNVKK